MENRSVRKHPKTKERPAPQARSAPRCTNWAKEFRSREERLKLLADPRKAFESLFKKEEVQ